jgi:predicted PurR-regulated permease PerM
MTDTEQDTEPTQNSLFRLQSRISGMEVSWTPSRAQVAWGVVGTLIVAAVVFVVASFVGAIVVGVFLYYAVRPVERRLERDRVGSVVSLLVVGLPILLVLSYGAMVGLRELQQFLGDAGLAQYRTVIEPYVGATSLSEPGAIVQLVRGNLSMAASYVGLVATWLGRIFVAFTVAYYLLREDGRVAAWYRDTFESAPSAISVAEAVDDELTTIYTGNLITIGVTALIAAAVFYAMSWVFPRTALVQYPILFGLLLGVFTLVPAVGMKLIYVPYTLVLGYRAWIGSLPTWAPVVFFLVTLLVIDSFPDIFIRSYLSKGGINMGLIMLTYILSSIAFGWYGIFLGPIILVLALEFAKQVLPKLVAGRTVSVEGN